MNRHDSDTLPLFRQAQSSDRERILEIIRGAQARMKARGSRQWQDGYPAGEDIDLDIGRGCGYVLCDGQGAIAAYGAVIFAPEESYERIDGAWRCEGPYAVVHRLAVAGEALRRGVATEFLLRALRLARSHGRASMRIDTNFDNEGMLRTLAALGFVRCGLITCRSGSRIAFERPVE